MGEGACFSGAGLVAIVALKIGGFFDGFFDGSIVEVLENVGGLAIALVAAFIVFYLGATLYNMVLKRLDFLKKPIFKALALVLIAVGVVFVMGIWWP